MRARTVGVTALSAVALMLTLVSVPAQAARDPRLTRALFVNPSTSAAAAAQHEPGVRTLAKTPQAFWATDHLPRTRVKSAVRTYAQRAKKAKRTPVVAVYAIPGRDCGAHSAGSFNSSTYKRWVAQLASGLKGTKAIAILEPDALAMLGDCKGQGKRTELLRYATKKLKKAGVWVYIDAGHARWKPASVMAKRLKSAGISHARGFSTNVSNFQRTSDEKAYAKQVIRELKKLKITGKRYVIDTSRNGGRVPEAWESTCNPWGVRVGSKPRVYKSGSHHANLWVKNPGESDGACNGWPAAGQWSTPGALELLSK
jgi:endoglucanase